MLKDALQYLATMAIDSKDVATIAIGGRLYADGELKEMEQPTKEPDTLRFHTLSGLVDYVKSKFDNPNLPMALQVRDETSVVYGTELFGYYNQRMALAGAVPFLGDGFGFDDYNDLESFVIGLQSQFVQDDTTAAILHIVGNVNGQQVQTVVDDGTSQQVTARAGVARVENVVLPNPVVLRPFRTFQEVEQPESRFVLRLSQSGEGELPKAALFECEDCMWKLAAVNSIRDYLRDALPEVHVFA